MADDDKIRLEFKNKDVPAHKEISIAGGGELEAGEKIEIKVGDKEAEYTVPAGKRLPFSIHCSGTELSEA